MHCLCKFADRQSAEIIYRRDVGDRRTELLVQPMHEGVRCGGERFAGENHAAALLEILPDRLVGLVFPYQPLLDVTRWKRVTVVGHGADEGRRAFERVEAAHLA